MRAASVAGPSDRSTRSRGRNARPKRGRRCAVRVDEGGQIAELLNSS